MKKIKNIIILLTCITFSFAFKLKAQELPVHEQYISDYMLVNPSFTGLAEITSIKLSHKQQWIGFRDAPYTSFLSIKHKLKNRDGGIGGYIFSDQNGPNSRYGIQLSGSFQFTLKNKRGFKQMLSFGISFRGLFHVLDESKFDKDIYDPIIRYGKESSFIPNANFGILYSSNNSFVGIAVDNLIPYSDKIYNESFEPSQRLFFNAHAGNVLQFKNYSRQLRSSLIYKSDFRDQNQIGINLRYHFLFSPRFKSSFNMSVDEFWFGVLYKHTLDKKNIAPLSVLPSFGLKFGKFTMSYSYEIGLTSIQKYHYGTHQISIGFKTLHNNINWRSKNAMLYLDEF